MPTPKFRTSASQRDKRRSHHGLSEPSMSTCPSCGTVTRPHTICHKCGSYKGKVMVQPKSSGEGWSGEDFTKG